MCVKRIALGQPPKALCLHLRRAYWTNTGRHMKLSGHVRFPLSLSTAPYSAANLPPLSSLSQQYVPDAAQTFWMSSASGGCSGGGGGGGGCGSGVTPPAANSATLIPCTEGSPGIASCGAHHAGESQHESKVKTTDVANAQPAAGCHTSGREATSGAVTASHSEADVNGEGMASTIRAGVECPGRISRAGDGVSSSQHGGAASYATDASADRDAPTEASTEAEDAAALLAESSHSSEQNTSSTAPSSMSGDAPSKAKQTASPQRNDKPVRGSPHADQDCSVSVSAFAHTEADRAAEQGNQSPMAGQVAAAGPVKRLLASHALSLASSLTSESSLLNDEALDQDAADESRYLIKPATTGTAMDESAAGPSKGSSPTRAYQGLFAKGPMQKVLASHALSLTSSLTSDTSMGAALMLEDTASLPMVNDGNQSVMNKAPAPDSLVVQDSGQAVLTGEVSDEAIAVDAGDTVATPDSNYAVEASTSSGNVDCPCLQPDAGAQNVGCSSYRALCSTEPLITEDGPTARQMKDANEVQDPARKQYHLAAAVVHHGGASSSGHYTVYRRVRLLARVQTHATPSHDQWFSISDESVHKVDVRDVLGCEATLLMYEQY